MKIDELRTARLLFAAERAAGAVDDAALYHPDVRAAVRVRPFASRPVRLGQRLLMKAGRLDVRLHRFERARVAILGADAAALPPRLLIRMDEYPHYLSVDQPKQYGDEAFAPWREIMARAGCRHLVAVVPAPCSRPLDPTGGNRRDLTDAETSRLKQLESDGVAFALHGYDHRTRAARPRQRSEFSGLTSEELGLRLTQAEAALASRTGLRPSIIVPPYNRFDRAQFTALAARYDVICGGPESVAQVGFHATPQWRQDAVWLPAYPPYYATAAEVLQSVERRLNRGFGLVLPIVLHWGWEAKRGWDDLRRFADQLAPYAADWTDFLADVRASR